MTKVNIDEVSAEAKALIDQMKVSESDVASTRKLVQPKLKLVWKALEAGQTVSGCQNKKEWCKHASITPRYAQYLIKDGSRKRTRNDDEPRVRFEWRIWLEGITVEPTYATVDVNFELPYDNPGGNVEYLSYRKSYGDVRVIAHYPESDEKTGRKLLFQEMVKTIKALRLPKISWKEFLEHFKEYGETPATRKERRSQGAQRAARTRARNKTKTPGEDYSKYIEMLKAGKPEREEPIHIKHRLFGS